MNTQNSGNQGAPASEWNRRGSLMGMSLLTLGLAVSLGSPVSAETPKAGVARFQARLVSRGDHQLYVQLDESGKTSDRELEIVAGAQLPESIKDGDLFYLECVRNGGKWQLLKGQPTAFSADQQQPNGSVEPTRVALGPEVPANEPAKPAAPKAPEPKPIPKAEQPKADAPKPAAPKADAPKADAPKAEDPKNKPATPAAKPEDPAKTNPAGEDGKDGKSIDPAELDEKETPKIVNIEIEGNQTIPSDEILQVVSTRIGDLLLKPRMSRDAQAIYDLGFFTDVKLDVRVAPGGVRLVFRVFENPIVNKIEFSGNKVAPSDKLASLMETKTGKILNTRTLFADLQTIVRYYDDDLGYYMGNLHIEDMNFDKGVLNVKIKDGMVINKIDVQGVTVFPVEQVQALITSKPGELFNKKSLTQDLAAISKLYEDNDYIVEPIKPTQDIDKGTITLKVPEAVLQEIRVEGNIRTTTDTVLRNMRSKPGMVLQRRRLQNDFRRLQNLGFFKKVDPNFEPGTEPGKQILILDVDEQKTGLATIGLGYAGGGTGAIRPGITGAVSLSDRNLFGEGKSASVQIQAGAQTRSAGLSLLDPAINGNQDSLGASLFYNEVTGLRQPVTQNGVTNFAFYQDKRFGGSVTYGHPFMDDLRGFVTLRHENIDISQDPGSLFTPAGLGTGTLNSVGLSAIYDTRDDLFSPHTGSFLNGSVTMAGLGGTYNFNKYVFEGRHYIPLGERSTIALRGWYGALGNANGAPITEYFFAGGVDTLRGYVQNQFFGSNFAVLNAEYRFPIGNIKFLNGAVFGDVGNAWTPGVTSSRLYADAGLGLRIVFPTLGLGVIRLDYAFGELGGRASIGIGQSF